MARRLIAGSIIDPCGISPHSEAAKAPISYKPNERNGF
jgi:hypothetical protein